MHSSSGSYIAPRMRFIVIVLLLITMFSTVTSLHIPHSTHSPVISSTTKSNPKSKPTSTSKSAIRASRLRMIPVENAVEWVQPVTDAANYVFVPPEVTQDIYLGAIIATLPFIWATKTFGTRIVVQRECLVCKGSGLVYVTKKGNALNRPRKCFSCGGFLPWLGWKMFFFSSFFDVGNGGPLQRPAKDYDLTNQKIRSGELDYSSPKPSENADDEEEIL